MRTETSGAGGAALATGVRRRAANVPTTTRATATAAVQVAGLIKRFIRTPAVEGDDYRTDSAVMNYVTGKVPEACFSEAGLLQLGGAPPPHWRRLLRRLLERGELIQDAHVLLGPRQPQERGHQGRGVHYGRIGHVSTGDREHHADDPPVGLPQRHRDELL